MSVSKSADNYRELGNALARLREMWSAPENHLGRVDATIQRFEFVIELYWKTFKHLLEAQGVLTTSPREAFAGAYRMRWIDKEELWLGMLKDRNQTSHTYHEPLAKEILQRIGNYLPVLENTYAQLRSQLGA